MAGTSSAYQVDHLLGGVAGGCISTLVLHPLDLVRIRFAVNEGSAHSIRPQYSGYIPAAKSVFKARGIRGLYQGLAPNILGNTIAWGLYFQLYNVIKAHLREHPTQDLSALQHMLAGVLSGCIVLSVTNPIWVVKTRLCLQYETSSTQYRGMIHALTSIAQTHGVRGWYKGFLPGLVGTSHGAIQFVIYDELKYRYCLYYQAPPQSKLNTGWYLTFAAISKMLAVSVTYPYQVVRARLQDQHAQYKGAIDCVRTTYGREGAHGFYKGMLGSIIRVTPATCITFVTYEHVVQWYRMYYY